MSPKAVFVALLVVLCAAAVLVAPAAAEPNSQLDRLKSMFLNSYKSAEERVRKNTDALMRSAQLDARGGVHETALIQFEMIRKKLADLEEENPYAESELEAEIEQQEKALVENKSQQKPQQRANMKPLKKAAAAQSRKVKKSADAVTFTSRSKFANKAANTHKLSPVIISRLDTRRRRVAIVDAHPRVQWYGAAQVQPSVAVRVVPPTVTELYYNTNQFQVPDYAPAATPRNDQLSVTMGEKGRRFYSSEATAPVRAGSDDIIGHPRNISPIDRQIASIMRGN